MKYAKAVYILAIALVGLLLTFTWINQPDLFNLIVLIGAFSFLSYQNPLHGLYIIMLLPVLGEFSRFQLLGRSIIISDLIIPLFIITFLFQKNFSLLPRPALKQIKILDVFLIFAAFSLLLSLIDLPLNDVLSSSLYLIRLVEYLALFPITVILLNSQESVSKTIKFIVLAALLIAATGFIQLIFLPSLLELSKTQGYDPHLFRLVGSWLDPNFIGGFFAFIFCLFTGILLYQKNNRHRVLLTIFLLIIASALFLTYSRSAYVALAAGILILGILKSPRLLVVILIIGSLGIALSDRAQERVGELVTSVNSIVFNSSENPDPTARLRIKNWEQTLTLIAQKPFFGHGYNTLTFTKLNQGFIQDEDIHSASGSDSSLLTIFATTGLFGLLLFLLFLANSLLYSFRHWRNSPTNQKGLYLGLFTALISLIIHSNFVNSLLFPQVMIFFFISLGLLYSLPTSSSPKINN